MGQRARPAGSPAASWSCAALVAVLAVAGGLATAGAQQATFGGIDQRNLLEPERAFALSARGLDPKTVEVLYIVANGYYLYRDKLKLSIESAELASPPSIPPGKLKQDDFFGNVETFRGQLAIRLALKTAMPAASVDLIAESQGCADVGVCYPPQRQRLTLRMPAQGAGAGTLVEAAPAERPFFK